MRSTNKEPHYDLCPTGITSWCGFQRDLANNTTACTSDHPLAAAIAEEILPIFKALSSKELLAACLHGGTQNQNESFNALVWQRATKETHSSLPTVELATYLAIGHFNDGAKTISSILEELQIDSGVHCRKAWKSLDKARIYHGSYCSSEKAKRRRRAIRNKKKGYSDNLEDAEGPQYEAGAF